MSKALDDLTASVTALVSAVTAVEQKISSTPPTAPDESTQFEALVTQLNGITTKLQALVSPPA